MSVKSSILAFQQVLFDEITPREAIKFSNFEILAELKIYIIVNIYFNIHEKNFTCWVWAYGRSFTNLVAQIK